MAIIKHVSSKNSSYASVLEYLKYEHDQKTGKPLKDEKGKMIERKNTMVSSINCNVDTWAIECLEANKRYSKNQKKGDVKNHSYIISFSPKDQERGLTLDKAHALGVEFAKKNLRGYQTLIYTHDDGHNGSGNIHVHIVINSVRVKEMNKKDYMTKKCDYAEGLKHRDTGAFRYHYANEIMKMCERENLHQIDLHKSKTGINEKEYYAQKRGQKREEHLAVKEKRKPTVFDTDKEEIRQVIDEAKNKTIDIKDNKQREEAIIKYAKENYGVEIKESRGRWSYRHPSWNGEKGKRSRPISDKKLGSNYRKEQIVSYGIDKQNERTNDKRDSRAGNDARVESSRITTAVRDRAIKGIELDIEQRKRESFGIEKTNGRNSGAESRVEVKKSDNRKLPRRS